jgi:hypothetical protein
MRVSSGEAPLGAVAEAEPTFSGLPRGAAPGAMTVPEATALLPNMAHTNQHSQWRGERPDCPCSVTTTPLRSLPRAGEPADSAPGIHFLPLRPARNSARSAVMAWGAASALPALLPGLAAKAGSFAIPMTTASPGLSGLSTIQRPAPAHAHAEAPTLLAVGPPKAPGALPQDAGQLVLVMSLILAALGRHRGAPSGSSSLLPRSERWASTPHERLQDPKYLGLILEAEQACSDQEGSGLTAPPTSPVPGEVETSPGMPQDPGSRTGSDRP